VGVSVRTAGVGTPGWPRCEFVNFTYLWVQQERSIRGPSETAGRRSERNLPEWECRHVSTLIRNSTPKKESVGRRPLVVGGFALAMLTAFLIAPGSVASKAYVALHGLCAQRPSHSLLIGDTTLPMDARMTGIYLGAATTVVWLIAARRLRAARTPSLPVLVLLASFVVAMAVDGVNALLVDLRLPSIYEPSNLIRIGTGVLAGTTLGLALGYLFASSVWAHGGRERSVVMNPVELLSPIGVSAALAFLGLSNVPWLYAPFAVGLVVAAVGVFWLLGIVVLALLSDTAWSYQTWSDLTPLAFTSLITAVVTVGALSWLRFAAEQLLGLPRLT
jgi:uncharacterized membrane protein